jgi:hypothetical protein
MEEVLGLSLHLREHVGHDPNLLREVLMLLLKHGLNLPNLAELALLRIALLLLLLVHAPSRLS